MADFWATRRGNPHPRRETWQVGSTLGEFVTPYEFARSTTFCHALPQEYGLPRRFAPRNDSGGTYLHPRTRLSFCMSLRTSAHTGAAIRIPAGKLGKLVVLRANSLRLTNSPEVLLSVTPYRRRSGLPRRFAPRNDMQKLAACPRLQLRATSQTRSRLRIRLKCCFSFCAAAGDADCPVASLLAMTVGEVPSRPSALPPLTPGMFPRTLRTKRSCTR